GEEQGAEGWRRAGAGKCALPSGGRKERRGILQATGSIVRGSIWVRGVRVGAPRTRFGGRHHEVRAEGGGRFVDGEGAELHRESHQQSDTTVCSDFGRGEGQRQD